MFFISVFTNTGFFSKNKIGKLISRGLALLENFINVVLHSKHENRVIFFGKCATFNKQNFFLFIKC